MAINIAAIQFPVFNPYSKPTIEIYVSGCTNNCKGCHNPQLKNFDFGEKLDFAKLGGYLYDRKDLFGIIGITGGEFLDQDLEEAKLLIRWLALNYASKELWLFTGKEKKDIPSWGLMYFDKIKVGRYDETKKQDGFPASTNQILLTKGIDY